MDKAIKIFALVCGITAFIFCLAGGLCFQDDMDRGLAFYFVGMAFFTGPLLIILVFGGIPSAKPAAKMMPKSKGKPKGKPQKQAKQKTKPATGETATVIYVGNLSPEANETVLKTAFSGFGEIKKVQIIKERSGRPKGYGFVEMIGKDKALAAIESLNGEELAGRPLKVNLAKPKGQSQPRGRGGKGRNQNKTQPQKDMGHSDNVTSRPNIFE